MTKDSWKCTNGGCNAMYDPSENHETACQYHPGTPVFQDTAKSWSCCKKQAYSFDNFLKIAGCQVGKHATVAKQEKPVAPAPAAVKGGVEHFGSSSSPATQAAAPVIVPDEKNIKPKIIESLLSDPQDSVVPEGAKCLRPSCQTVFPASDPDCKFHNGGISVKHFFKSM
ncbi:MAG: hypothetical protein SGCHY_003226 [Lobulomycetales sp.]